jgi:hypothetical protein
MARHGIAWRFGVCFLFDWLIDLQKERKAFEHLSQKKGGLVAHS